MSCVTSPMRRLTALASPLNGSPAIDTVPRSGGVRPQSIATVVDLPAPLGPSSPTISPLFTASETPATATLAPYDFQRPVASSIGGLCRTPLYTAQPFVLRNFRAVGAPVGYSCGRVVLLLRSAHRARLGPGLGDHARPVVQYLRPARQELPAGIRRCRDHPRGRLRV